MSVEQPVVLQRVQVDTALVFDLLQVDLSGSLFVFFLYVQNWPELCQVVLKRFRQSTTVRLIERIREPDFHHGLVFLLKLPNILLHLLFFDLSGVHIPMLLHFFTLFCVNAAVVIVTIMALLLVQQMLVMLLEHLIFHLYHRRKQGTRVKVVVCASNYY